MQKPIIKTTADGSNTLYVPEIDESYHSTNGAVQESLHIFINDGFHHCKKKTIKVLEIGFGTGLNAFLTLIEAEKENKSVIYTGLEFYPVETEEAVKLNYPELIEADKRAEFEALHRCEWNREVKINPDFTLIKQRVDFTKTEFSEEYDVVYFDAFSPEKQPEMWSEKIFEKLYLCAGENAILTTYCAKGIVRRALQSAGFVVERLPGPIGKREILRARKPIL